MNPNPYASVNIIKDLDDLRFYTPLVKEPIGNLHNEYSGDSEGLQSALSLRAEAVVKRNTILTRFKENGLGNTAEEVLSRAKKCIPLSEEALAA